MGVLHLPQKFLAQPQYAAPLDPLHWAFKDIVFAFSAGRGFSDGKHPALAGTLTTFTTLNNGPRGKYLENTVAGNNAFFANSTDHDTLGGVTLIGLVQPSSVSGQMTVISKDAAGGGSNTPFGLLLDSGAVSLNRANAGFRVWKGVATLAAGQIAVVAATQGANIGTAPKFYIDGRLDTGSPVNLFGGSGTGAPVATTQGVKVSANTSFGNRFLGGIYGALVLSRECTPEEVAELSLQLWTVWKAPSRWIHFISVGGTTYNQSTGGSITIAGALAKQTGKSLSGSSTPAGALSKLTSINFAGSLTSVGQLVKQTAKFYSGSITGSGSLATMILFTASMGGSITPSGAIAKMTMKALDGATTLAGAISKMTAKGLGGELTMVGALAKLTARALSGSVTVAGAVATSYQVLKSLAGSITPTGALGAVYIAFVAGVLKLLSLMGVGQ